MSDERYYLLRADIDECETNSDDCDQNAECHNTVGSHDCQCHDGYTGSGFECSGMPFTCITKPH